MSRQIGKIGIVGYARHARYFHPIRVQDKVLWYLNRNGRLAGNHGVTRQPVGEIVSNDSDAGFQRANSYYNPSFQASDMPVVLTTAKAVCAVDLAARESRPIFTAGTGDQILGLSQTPGYINPATSNRTLIATLRSIQLIDPDGKVVFKIPYDPAPTQYPTLNTFSLTSSAPYAIRMDPDYRLNSKSGGNLPIKVKWINADGS